MVRIRMVLERFQDKWFRLSAWQTPEKASVKVAFGLTKAGWVLAGAGTALLLAAPALAASSPLNSEADTRFEVGFTTQTLGKGWLPTRATPEQTFKTAQAQPDSPPGFRWMVQKDQAGIAFSGSVPNRGVQKFHIVRAGGQALEETRVTQGAPDDFVSNSLAGIDALKLLSQGRASFEQGNWVLTGTAPSLEVRENLLSKLARTTNLDDWQIDIQVPPQSATPPDEPPRVSNNGQDAPDGAQEIDLNYRVSAEKQADGQYAIAGSLPTLSLRRYVGILTGGASLDDIEIASVNVPGFSNTLIAGLEALAELDSGQLSYKNGAWELTGQAIDDSSRSAATQRVTQGGNDPGWNINITLVPELEICKRAANAFMETEAILFAPASSQLTARSIEALKELAVRLQSCPTAQIYVEGHTDADGPAQDNMTLSVKRAESVVESLIAAGVSDTRLYAVGYGETLPIASNETRAGKAQNRRIEFVLK